ncbi:MAG: MFS transporter [Lentisphaerae bacterium]|nr:MFS transporter [Lentisphaerota bacterium]
MNQEYKPIGLKIAVLSLSLLTIMAAAAVSPALAKIKAAFPDVGKTVIKLTLTLPALLIIPFSLISGWLAAKWTPRKTLITGLIIFCIGGMGGGLAANITQLLAFRAVLGIGVGLIMPLSTSLIADLFEGDERTKMMGLSGSVSHFGGVIFLILSGWLACISWRAAFAVYALGFLSLALTLTRLPEWQKKRAQTGDSFQLPGAVWTCSLLGALMMIAFYAVPTNMALFIEDEESLLMVQTPLMESREQLAESVQTGVLPETTIKTLAEKGITLQGKISIAEEEQGKRWIITDERRSYIVKKNDEGLAVCKTRLGRPAVAGLALSTMTLAGVISGIILAFMTKIFKRLLPAVTIALMGVGFWLLNSAESMTIVFAGVSCIGLSSGFMMPMLLLQVSKAAAPAARAFAMAIVSSGVYLGQFVSPIILEKAGLMAGNSSIRSQFGLLAIFLGASAAVALVLAAFKKGDPAMLLKVH